MSENREREREREKKGIWGHNFLFSLTSLILFRRRFYFVVWQLQVPKDSYSVGPLYYIRKLWPAVAW
jgi:hypothetical protein